MSTTPAAHTTPAQPVKQVYAKQNTPSSTGQTRTTNTSTKQLQPAPTKSGLTRPRQKDKAWLRSTWRRKDPTTTAQQQIGRS
ncbi:unnamed protein product [Macrosiphum euphorbiae]|uniref:Uncharacterized protein n=1 Tax=Macrosiphum euphorbiae TaxID=13131 RepID=A0AAV0XQQ5_9HEMI|nr:unnamed protein product [Macrosiphum euphorbiae]